METPKKNTVKPKKSKFVLVDPSKVSRGDTIYIDNKEDSVPYLVVDMGNPYMMIENLETGFCYVYHYTKLYIKK